MHHHHHHQLPFYSNQTFTIGADPMVAAVAAAAAAAMTIALNTTTNTKGKEKKMITPKTSLFLFMKPANQTNIKLVFSLFSFFFSYLFIWNSFFLY